MGGERERERQRETEREKKMATLNLNRRDPEAWNSFGSYVLAVWTTAPIRERKTCRLRAN
jgi:hypothetical protein